MAFTEKELAPIRAALDEYIQKARPPEHLREKVDLAYRIERQSVTIFEIRPKMPGLSEKIELPVAKATYVRTTKRWNIYWMRADLKWHSYYPHPKAVFIDEFVKIVEEDSDCCFWG